MNTYSLRSSLEERARKKSPILDIAAPKKRSALPIRETVLPAPIQFVQPRIERGLDGIQRKQEMSSSQSAPWRSFFKAKRMWQWSQSFLTRGQQLFGRLLPTFAPHKMLYGSLVGGIAFGMVSMAFIEHAFGPGVFARSDEAPASEGAVQPVETAIPLTANEEYVPDQDIFFEYFGQVTKEKYEESIRDMVKGYPIEAMLPYIFEQDRLTAAFLIGIGKKESNWGKRIPVLDGQDCFNYWGYRGIRRMMGTGGHTCFNSRKDAVETVAARLNKLVRSEKLNTPEKMIVWKCGFSCQGHSRESVKKWIADVDMYFSQLSDE